QACTRTTASPGPGSGTWMVVTSTGLFLPVATTPRTSVTSSSSSVDCVARALRCSERHEPTRVRLAALRNRSAVVLSGGIGQPVGEVAGVGGAHEQPEGGCFRVAAGQDHAGASQQRLRAPV